MILRRFKTQHLRWLVAVLLLAADCAGTPIHKDRVQQLRIGMTGDEVKAIMGKPYSTVSRADGVDVWVWSFGTSFGAQAVSVVFQNGKVSSVPKIP